MVHRFGKVDERAVYSATGAIAHLVARMRYLLGVELPAGVIAAPVYRRQFTKIVEVALSVASLANADIGITTITWLPDACMVLL